MNKLIAGAVASTLALTGAAVEGPAPAGIADAPQVTEWQVPWDGTRPRDPYVDRKGRVWFVGQEGNYVAYLEPKSGKFERYEIEEGTHPHNLVVAPDGMIWFTGNRNGRLVKFDPATRKLTNYPMPDPKVDDPHTMVLDAAGNAWFTAQNSAVVGRLDAKSGKIRLWETGSGTRPYGIEVDDGQRPWYVLFGTNQVGTIDLATMKERRFELPDGARPRRIVVAKDAIWYGDYARGYLGRLDPATGKVTFAPCERPNGEGQPCTLSTPAAPTTPPARRSCGGRNAANYIATFVRGLTSSVLGTNSCKPAARRMAFSQRGEKPAGRLSTFG